MDSTEPMDLDENLHVCRLCLSEESLENVFEEEGLQKWIVDLLSIVVTTEDHISQSICAVCRIRLADFHDFRVQCHKVQSLLIAKIPEQRKDFDLVNQSLCVVKPSTPPIQCHVCHQVFTLKRHLVKHIETHETETRGEHEHYRSNEEDLTIDVNDIKKELLEEVEDGTTQQKIIKNINSSDINYEELRPQENPDKLEHDATNLAFVHDLGEQQFSVENDIVVEPVKVEAHSENVLLKFDETPEVNRNHLDNQILETNRKKPRYKNIEVPCVICGKVLRNKHLLWNHNQRVHGPKNFPCLNCGIRFATKRDMNLHFQTKTHSKKIEEEKAKNKTVNNPDDASTNMTEKADANDEKLFPSIQKPNGEEELQGDLCQKVLPPKRKNILSHKRQTQVPENFPCSICDKPFRLRESMERHKKTHQPKPNHQMKTATKTNSVAKRFECDICHNTLIDSHGLKKHKQYAHGPKDYKCHICDFQFTTTAGLYSHLKWHARDNDIKESLQKEQNVVEKVTNNEPVETFNQNNAEVFQDGDGRTVCRECNKDFPDLQGYWMHFKYEHKKKRKCFACNVGFVTNKRFVNHLLTVHAKEDGSYQSLKWEECGKVFSMAGQMTALNALHGLRIYCCKLHPK